MAWGAAELILERAPWRWVLASDVLYERRNVDLLLGLLPRLVDETGEVLIADPSRVPAERFLELAAERWYVRSTMSPRADAATTPPMSIQVHAPSAIAPICQDEKRIARIWPSYIVSAR